MEIPKWTSGPICILSFLSGPVSNFLFRIETSANKVEITKQNKNEMVLLEYMWYWRKIIIYNIITYYVWI